MGNLFFEHYSKHKLINCAEKNDLKSVMKGYGFSQDIEQHTLYMSMIVYLQ